MPDCAEPLDWADQMKLNAMSRLGKEVWLADRRTGISTLWGIVDDEVDIVVDGAKHVLQRIRLAPGVRQEGQKYGYRTGAFFVDARTGSVKWTQYSLALSEGEYRELLTRAKRKGWPIF